MATFIDSTLIVHSEWLRTGVIVHFSDGSAALFPAKFLHTHSDRYRFIDQPDWDEETPEES